MILTVRGSDEFIALDELGLCCDGHVTEVEDLAEERLASRPLNQLFFREQEKAESESDQEDQLEKIDPDRIQYHLHEGQLHGCLL
eukprot:CAMPEP_0170461796 /NCGR_PEP_ID=MMETSP0123-20130129/7555_1 /TAXON_ID=182087 /ORGANISM="Favella ehrenbergii, Strain Fehren 1" /LENGTH=84 /DNA_ID=CAMNT_0010726881 /DNA_START=64 /DNA_END=318 /DNA_ORIENTATION=-